MKIYFWQQYWNLCKPVSYPFQDMKFVLRDKIYSTLKRGQRDAWVQNVKNQNPGPR